MLASIPALFSVFLLCAFIFLVFGIVGVQLWPGALRGRCQYADPEVAGSWVVAPGDQHCPVSCETQQKIDPNVECIQYYGSPCRSPQTIVHTWTNGSETQIDTDMACLYFENPNFGYTGFDNIGMAFLTIFTSITLEGWVDVMYGLNASWGIGAFNAFYFICLILFGSFFLLNLALAVIWDEYEKAEL